MFLSPQQLNFADTQLTVLLSIQPSPRKTATAKDFLVTTQIHQVRWYLGLFAVFRKFIDRDVGKSKPLSGLLLKDAE
jgi:hypothetical protein